jgi:hypothetical protein
MRQTGLPDGIFSNQKSQIGTFFSALEWKWVVYSLAIWNIFWPFGILCGHSGNLVELWYSFPDFGIFCQEKSGNPCAKHGPPKMILILKNCATHIAKYM